MTWTPEVRERLERAVAKGWAIEVLGTDDLRAALAHIASLERRLALAEPVIQAARIWHEHVFGYGHGAALNAEEGLHHAVVTYNAAPPGAKPEGRDV